MHAGANSRRSRSAAFWRPPTAMRKTRKRLGWPSAPPFFVPRSARERFREALGRGAKEQADRNRRPASDPRAHAALARELPGRLRGELPDGCEADAPGLPAHAKGTRDPGRGCRGDERDRGDAPGAVRGFGRSPPVNAHRTEAPRRLQSTAATERRQSHRHRHRRLGRWRLAGRNRHFGVRAHAMGAVVNGLAAHGFIGHGAAFPIVSDCRRPLISLAALMGLHVGHVFTHRSPARARFRGWS